MTDALDTVLSQATVVAYAVPEVGAVVAGGVSILQAIIDTLRPVGTPPAEYTLAQAISDLGQKIHDELEAQKTEAELATVQGWQLDVTHTAEDLADFATTGTPADAENDAQAFLHDHDFGKTFGAFALTTPASEERVRSLGTYFMARTTYHSLCMGKLQYLARAHGLDPDDEWTAVRSRIRTRLEDSLSEALDYARRTVAMLDDAYWNAEERARAKAANETVAFKRNAAFTGELRRIRTEAHLRYASRTDVADYRQFIELFDQTLAGLRSSPLAPRADGGTPPQVGIATAAAPAAPTLGPRPPGVARFLYETSATGGWVNVVADSAVSPGSVATQDAGSNLAGIYYRFGGDSDTLNGEFVKQLTDAGQLQAANQALAQAYDNHYGAGAFDADSAGSPPRQDRLTSLIVPLSPATPPVGPSVYAVVYSVGPQLGSKGIEDEAGYRQIYADAFAAIDEWNQQHPAIENLRLTLLSTEAFAGTSGGPTLRAQAAGLVLDAAVEALTASPLLATLTFLVNTNDTAGAAERVAFDTAARARGVTPTLQGFDVAL